MEELNEEFVGMFHPVSVIWGSTAGWPTGLSRRAVMIELSGAGRVGPASANVTILARFDFVPAQQTPVARRCSGRMLPNMSCRIWSSKTDYSPGATPFLSQHLSQTLRAI